MKYFTVNIDEAQRLGLTGSDLLVWGALQYLAKHQAWKGSTYELAKYSACGSRLTASRAIKRLAERGYVQTTDAGYSLVQNEPRPVQNEPRMVQNAPKLQESTKENINNKQDYLPKGGGSVDFSVDFLKFWAAYKPLPEYDNRKVKCYEQWQKLPSDWRKLATEKATEHLPDTNPFFWLKEEAFLRVGLRPVSAKVGNTSAPEGPHWLTGEEQEESLRMGVILVVCQNPETGKFGAVTKEEAEQFGLTIKRVM